MARKTTTSTPKKTVFKGPSTNFKRIYTPVIPLERPETPTLRKDQYLTFKLRSTPTDETSTTYNLTAPFFRNKTPEELLLFIDNIKKVMVGQNMTTGLPKYALVKCLLQGEALTQFTLDAVTLGNETNANFEEALKKLIIYVSPKRALVI